MVNVTVRFAHKLDRKFHIPEEEALRIVRWFQQGEGPDIIYVADDKADCLMNRYFVCDIYIEPQLLN